MARKSSAKPWFHSRSGFWCTTHEGQRKYLDRDFQTASLKLRQLRTRQREVAENSSDWLDASFAALADEYLSDVQARRSAVTYTSCRYRLRRALEIVGTELRVGQFKKLHLARIEQAMLKIPDQFSPTTIRDTLAAVQGVFSWAVKNDLIITSPVTGFVKPAARSRNRIIQPDEFQALLRASDPRFRQVLLALRLTGCRPGEIRSLIWAWVDLNGGFWVLPKHKTVTRQRQPRPRIIPLPPAVFNLCRWLSRRPHAEADHVFLNQHAKPYSKDTFVRKMQRVRVRAGVEAVAGENLVLYSARHSFCTAALGKVTDTELAELMGHSNNRLIQRYSHLNSDRLRDIQRRAQE